MKRPRASGLAHDALARRPYILLEDSSDQLKLLWIELLEFTRKEFPQSVLTQYRQIECAVDLLKELNKSPAPASVFAARAAFYHSPLIVEI